MSISQEEAGLVCSILEAGESLEGRLQDMRLLRNVHQVVEGWKATLYSMRDEELPT